MFSRSSLRVGLKNRIEKFLSGVVMVVCHSKVLDTFFSAMLQKTPKLTDNNPDRVFFK